VRHSLAAIRQRPQRALQPDQNCILQPTAGGSCGEARGDRSPLYSIPTTQNMELLRGEEASSRPDEGAIPSDYENLLKYCTASWSTLMGSLLFAVGAVGPSEAGASNRPNYNYWRHQSACLHARAENQDAESPTYRQGSTPGEHYHRGRFTHQEVTIAWSLQHKYGVPTFWYDRELRVGWCRGGWRGRGGG